MTPDAIIGITDKNETMVESSDDPDAESDRKKRKSRLVKGWRMSDAPTLASRSRADDDWGAHRTEPLRAEAKQQAFWPAP